MLALEISRLERRPADQHYSLTSTISTLTFLLMVLKFFDLRMWPHGYLEETVEPPLYSQALTAIWILFFLANLCINISTFVVVAKQNKLVFVYLFYCLLSSMFISTYPLTSMQFTMYYFASAVTALIFVQNASERVISISAISLALYYLFFSALSMLYPTISYMQGIHFGLFRGFAAHKNDMGQHLVFIFLMMRCAEFKSAFWKWVLACGVVYLLFLSYSAQAIILFIMIILAYSTLKLLSFFDRSSSIAILVILFIFTVAAVYADVQTTLFGELGKDENFSGRDVIWSFFSDEIARGNFFGYGLGVFFQDPVLHAQLVSYGIWWPISTAHSAYLEAVIALGYIGGGLFFLVLLSAVSRILGSMRANSRLQTVGGLLVAVSLIGGITARA